MNFDNETRDIARLELANRLFFKLYQCANMLHKTGTRAVEEEGLTTQQWAVLGALSRNEIQERGMSINELAHYLMMTRQNVSGLVGRMTRDGRVEAISDKEDRRLKLIRMTENGRRVWKEAAQPKIKAFYEAATEGLSTTDLAHSLHYMIRLLENMNRIDTGTESPKE